MALLGEDGFKRLARLNHERACVLAEKLEKVPGVKLLSDRFFNEFPVELTRPSEDVVKELAEKNIIAGYALDDNQLLVAATEMCRDDQMDQLCDALKDVLK
jgi:glycine dehydrogenase subunit 1